MTDTKDNKKNTVETSVIQSTKFYYNKGYQIIILLILINIIFWIISKAIYNDWFVTPYKYVAKFSSFSATLLMAISLILTTRAKVLEDLFGGLDRVYKAHHMVGRYAFSLILLHPLFLAINSANASSSLSAFFSFFLPRFDSRYNVGHALGIFCLLAFFFLLYLTIQSKISYEVWRKSHSFFGLLFSLIILHILTSGGDIPKYPVFAVWYYSWLVVGLGCYLWTTFCRYRFGKKYHYHITFLEKAKETYEIVLTPNSNTETLSYRAGQFLYVKFCNNNLPQEWHPYSIASFCENGIIKLGIKELGDYTSLLHNLRLMDKVELSGPYGRLSEKMLINPVKECVMIGAGTGITPMISLWEYSLKTKRPAKTTLFYLAKDLENATFNDDFVRLNNQYETNKNSYNLHLDHVQGFFNIDILAQNIVNFDNKFFFLCGPPRLVDMLIVELKNKGVKNTNIIVEDFDFGIGNKKWFSHFSYFANSRI